MSTMKIVAHGIMKTLAPIIACERRWTDTVMLTMCSSSGENPDNVSGQPKYSTRISLYIHFRDMHHDAVILTRDAEVYGDFPAHTVLSIACNIQLLGDTYSAVYRNDDLILDINADTTTVSHRGRTVEFSMNHHLPKHIDRRIQMTPMKAVSVSTLMLFMSPGGSNDGEIAVRCGNIVSTNGFCLYVGDLADSDLMPAKYLQIFVRGGYAPETNPQDVTILRRETTDGIVFRRQYGNVRVFVAVK